MDPTPGPGPLRPLLVLCVRPGLWGTGPDPGTHAPRLLPVHRTPYRAPRPRYRPLSENRDAPGNRENDDPDPGIYPPTPVRGPGAEYPPGQREGTERQGLPRGHQVPVREQRTPACPVPGSHPARSQRYRLVRVPHRAPPGQRPERTLDLRDWRWWDRDRDAPGHHHRGRYDLPRSRRERPGWVLADHAPGQPLDQPTGHAPEQEPP